MRKNSSAPETMKRPRSKERAWKAPRKIIHVDMDAFYASVEQRDRPELRGKPVIVGGNPEGRGVVSTASYEARSFGVHSAMPASQAKRLCPQAVFLRPDFQKYEEASRMIRRVFRNYTDAIQTVSLDEAYLDVTQNKLRISDPAELARLIKQNIFALTKLTASAGAAPNKFLAKIASDLKKPDGLVVVYPEETETFLAPLPVRKIPGVGPVTDTKLQQLGIKTCGDLAAIPRKELINHFGKFGLDLYDMARGLDDSPVIVYAAPQQIGSETTFEKDIVDLKTMEAHLREIAEIVAERLAEEGMKGRTVTLKVKYADFSQITRSVTQPDKISTAEEISKHAISLLRTKTDAGYPAPAARDGSDIGGRSSARRADRTVPDDQAANRRPSDWRSGRKKVRLLGISVSHFEETLHKQKQLEFF